MKDTIDLTNLKAQVKNFSPGLPRIKLSMFCLMHRIAAAIQEVQGNFFLDQIYDVLELAYGSEVSIEGGRTLSAIAEWLESDKSIDFLGDENGFYTYRVNTKEFPDDNQLTAFQNFAFCFRKF